MIIDLLTVPTIPSGNTHAPVVMVAEKGADLIKDLWLQPAVLRAEAALAAASNVQITNVTITNTTLV